MGARAVIVSVLVTAAAGGAALVVTPGGGGGGVTCDVNATTANFSTQVAATDPGETLCLASGNYGSWTGTNKSSPGITIREAEGATATFEGLNFFNVTADWFTLDGIDYEGGEWCDPLDNVTIKNAEQTGQLIVYAGGSGNNNRCTGGGQQEMIGANIVLENIDFTLSVCPDGTCLGFEGRVQFVNGPTGSNLTGFTIRDSVFDGRSPGSPCGDGIQFSGTAGNGVTVEGTEFVGIEQVACAAVWPGPGEAPHSDSVQYVGGGGTTFDGNWFHDVSIGIVKYDGGATGGTVVTNNVFGPNIDSDALTHGGLTGLVVRNNVFRDGVLVIGATHGGSASTNVVWQDNIQHANPTVNSGGSYASGSPNYNYCTDGTTCAGANSLNGAPAPSFTGGTTPTTWAGWALTASSRGTGVGSDGGDIGIRP